MIDRREPGRRREGGILAMLGLLLVVLHAPSLLRPRSTFLANVDWEFHLTNHAFARKAILEFGEYPLWCPYLGGGYPIYAHPEFPSGSPAMVATLVFGEVFGLKLVVLLLHAGMAGSTYFLARRALGFEPEAAVAATAVVAFSGWLPGKMWSGNLNELSLGLTPAVLGMVALYGREGGRWRLLFAGGVVALILADGKATFALCLFYVALWAALWGWERRGGRLSWNGRCAAAVAVVAAAALGLGAVKWLPAARWLGMWERPADADIFSRGRGYGSVMAVTAPELAEMLLAPARDTREAAYSIFVGAVPAVLALGALAADFRRVWRWAVLLAVSAFLAMGGHAPVDLFRPLHALPVFQTIQMPSKYFNYYVLLTLGLLCGECLRAGWLRDRAVLRRALCVAAVGGALWAGALEAPTFAAVAAEEPEAAAPGDFFQVRGRRLGYEARRPGLASPYRALRSNVGVIDWYTSVPRARVVWPKYRVERDGTLTPVEGYPGEAFVEPGGGGARARVTARTANRLRVRVKAAAGDVVVVNQHYHPSWAVLPRGDGEVVDYGGLLGVRLAGGGEREIELRFGPWDIRLGAAVSLLSLLVGLMVCRGRGKRSAGAPVRASSPSAGPSGS